MSNNSETETATVIPPEKWREACINYVAKAYCNVAGIEPIDSLDGAPNYWLFNESATKAVDEILAKFPGPTRPVGVAR